LSSYLPSKWIKHWSIRVTFDELCSLCSLELHFNVRSGYSSSYSNESTSINCRRFTAIVFIENNDQQCQCVFTNIRWIGSITHHRRNNVQSHFYSILTLFVHRSATFDRRHKCRRYYFPSHTIVISWVICSLSN
jgi:hypothetical protein